MKAAAIDIGTNTFHLVIADLSHRPLKVVYKTNIPVKLGEGRLNENVIIPEALERGLQALAQFADEIQRHGVKIVKATATSAVRGASNGADFVQLAYQRSGIRIDVIDGDQEAGLIYKGVAATGLISGTSLIMDIGGGSTEFIIANAGKWLWKKSYNIGAARLMQAYFHSDPLHEEERRAILAHIDSQVDDLKQACAQYKPEVLIGSAGAFETFAEMLNPELDSQTLASAEISLEGYHRLSATLLTSTHQQREQMKGLIPLRVDMIVMATLLTNYILEELQLKQLYLSTYDLKMGILQSMLDDQQES